MVLRTETLENAICKFDHVLERLQPAQILSFLNYLYRTDCTVLIYSDIESIYLKSRRRKTQSAYHGLVTH